MLARLYIFWTGSKLIYIPFLKQLTKGRKSSVIYMYYSDVMYFKKLMKY